MRKTAIIFSLLTGLALSGGAQISGPATIAAGSPGTWTLANAPVVNSYTWSPDGTSQPATVTATTITGGKLGANTAMTVADYPTIWNDNGHWYAFTISRGVTPGTTAALYRLDLGSDPTPSNISASNVVTTFNLSTLGLPAGRASHGGTGTGELVHAMAFDPDTKEWHLFWVRTGYNTGTGTAVNDLVRISRLDFGTSLGNTPAKATEITVPTTADYDAVTGKGKVNAQVAQSKFIRTDKGEFIMFIGSRWPDGIIRVNFGKDITNKTPKIDALPAIVTAGTGIGAAVSRSSALDVVQQNGKWFLFCSTTDANGTAGNELWRFDFGTDPTSTPTVVTGLGSLPGYNHWGLQIVPSACGKEYFGFINGRGTIYRLKFDGGDLTRVPTVETAGTAGSGGLPGGGDNSGLFAYTYKDTLYAIMGGASNNGLYSMRLPYGYNNEVPLHKAPGDNTFTHTYNTPGSYDLTAAVNLNGGGSTIYCYSVTVTAAPGQPGMFTAAPPKICQGSAGIVYTVPAVSGATSYEWIYTGTNVTLSGATTTTPTNTLNFLATATGGTLRVRAVNAAGSSAYRDTVITVNALPVVSSTNTGARSICTGDSLQLTASGGSGVSYQWKQGSTNVGANNATYYAKTSGSYTVTVTNTTTNCSATSTPATTLTVNQLPSVSVTNTGTKSICTGDSLQLTATASGVDYQWKQGAANVGTNSAGYYAKTAGNYTVTVTDKNTKCSATSAPATTLTVNQLPSVTLTPSGAQAICAGDSLQLTASGSSGVRYQWKQGTTVVGNAATYQAKAGGSYTVTVTNTTTSCAVTSAQVNLTVHSLPVASVTAGGPTILCQGDSVVLTAGTGTGYLYQWKDGAASVGSGANTCTGRTTGSYMVVVKDGATGCADSSVPLDVAIYPRPAATLTPGDTMFCEGGLVKLAVSSSDTALTYLWKNAAATIPLATADFLEITATGVYWVIVGRSQVASCEDSTNEVRVTVHPLPVADITWDEVWLHATPGHASYQWNVGGQPMPGASDSVFKPLSKGDYSVTVSDSNGCEKTSPVYNVNEIKTGIADRGKWMEQVKLYPNPVREVLYISSPSPVQATIQDALGRTVARSGPDAREIDVRALSSGIYMVILTTGDGYHKAEKVRITD